MSLIVAAYNERDSIAAKVLNSLELDYPSDRLEIIVASDGSDDGTNEIVAEHETAGVRLLAMPRVGKADALNAAVAAASGEIVVFSDANSMYDRGAIRALVRPLCDPTVGGVAGDQRYSPTATTNGSSEGERAYWNMERLLKLAESRGGSTISATGAIYAVRRSLFQGVPVGVTDDFAVSTSVIAQGYRLVFAPDAIAWESVSGSREAEWGRKVRVITRGLRGVYVRRRLLDPRRYGFYSLQLASHKVLRRLMAIPLLTIAAASVGLWRRGPIYAAAAGAQAVVYGLGCAGLLLSNRRIGRHPALAAPGYFLMVNAAAVVAAWNVVRGNRIDRWQPIRANDRGKEHPGPGRSGREQP